MTTEPDTREPNPAFVAYSAGYHAAIAGHTNNPYGNEPEDCARADEWLRDAWMTGHAAGRRVALADALAAHDERPAGYVDSLPAVHVVDEPTAGTIRAVGTVAPDPYDGVRHVVDTRGIVRRRGTAYVTGSLDWAETAPLFHLSTDARQVMAEYLDRVGMLDHRGARGGLSAVTCTRLADAILKDHIPRMVGTDAVSWSVALGLPADATQDEIDRMLSVVHLNPSDPVAAAIPYGYLPSRETARHAVRAFRNYQLAADGRLTRTGTRHAHRETVGHAVGILARHVLIPRPTVTRRGPRLTLSMGRARRGDPTGTACELLAPAADREHRWVGHRLVERPPVHRTRRAHKRAALRKARTITLTVDTAEQRASEMSAGTRVRFDTGTIRGTIARAATGAWSISATRDDGKVVRRSTLRQARYVRNVLANLAR